VASESEDSDLKAAGKKAINRDLSEKKAEGRGRKEGVGKRVTLVEGGRIE